MRHRLNARHTALNPLSGDFRILARRQHHFRLRLLALTFIDHSRPLRINQRDLRATLRVSVHLTFRTMHQQATPTDIGKEFRHLPHVFGMRHAGQTQRGILFKRRGKLCQRMGTVAHAKLPAEIQLSFQRRTQRANRNIDRLMAFELCLRLTGVTGRLNAHQGKNGFCNDPGWVFAHAVHHHREAQLVQQHRQQRRQVGLFTCTVITRNDDRHWLACRRR